MVLKLEWYSMEWKIMYCKNIHYPKNVLKLLKIFFEDSLNFLNFYNFLLYDEIVKRLKKKYSEFKKQ